jgi:hypothetical protein
MVTTLLRRREKILNGLREQERKKKRDVVLRIAGVRTEHIIFGRTSDDALAQLFDRTRVNECDLP